jgi:hypothetical protein
MTKKPATKKKTSKASAPSHVVNVKGNIVAKHDVIQGNQYQYNYGNQYHDSRRQIAQIASPQEFVAGLQELQGKLAQARQQPDLLPEHVESLEIVEGDVVEAIEEAKKPQPRLARIKARLDAAEGLMKSLGKSVTAAVGLGTAIAGFGQIALKLFGG